MAKKFLKRFFPTQATIKKHPSLQFLGHLLHDPNLFHLNRHSVSVAFFVGLFIAFAFPFPGQMPLAAFGALLFRCNLPISVALTWVTNPLTAPFCFYVAYVLGCFVLQIPPEKFQIEFTWAWVMKELGRLLPPFLLGSVLLGLIIGTLGYFGMQIFWRWHVALNWSRRQKERANAENEKNDHS